MNDFLQYEDEGLIDVRTFAESELSEISVFLGDSNDYGEGKFTSEIEKEISQLYEEAKKNAEDYFNVQDDIIEMPDSPDVREEDTLLFHLGTISVDLRREDQDIERAAKYLEHVTDYVLEGVKDSMPFLQKDEAGTGI